MALCDEGAVSRTEQTEERAAAAARVEVLTVVETDGLEERELKPATVPGGRSRRPAPFAFEARSERPDLSTHLTVAFSHQESRVELVRRGVEVVGITR